MKRLLQTCTCSSCCSCSCATFQRTWQNCVALDSHQKFRCLFEHPASQLSDSCTLNHAECPCPKGSGVPQRRPRVWKGKLLRACTCLSRSHSSRLHAHLWSAAGSLSRQQVSRPQLLILLCTPAGCQHRAHLEDERPGHQHLRVIVAGASRHESTPMHAVHAACCVLGKHQPAACARGWQQAASSCSECCLILMCMQSWGGVALLNGDSMCMHTMGVCLHSSNRARWPFHCTVAQQPTQADLLEVCALLMGPQISHPEARSIIEKGEMIPDMLVGDILLEALLANSCKSTDCGVLVDGFPRTAVQVGRSTGHSRGCFSGGKHTPTCMVTHTVCMCMRACVCVFDEGAVRVHLVWMAHASDQCKCAGSRL